MSYAPNRSDFTSQTIPNDSTVQGMRRAAPSRIALKKNPVLRRSQPLDSQADYPLIVHCHLCWDWVWQRPQQFLSRLSKRHPVLFIETIGPDPNLIVPTIRTM